MMIKMSDFFLGTLLLLVLTGFPMASSAQNKPSAQLTATQQAILRVEDELFLAIKDQDTKSISRILTADFVYRSPGNGEVGKDDFLKLITSSPIKILSLWGEELKVNVYGEVATLTGLQLAKTRNDQGKEEISAVMFTDVFVKRRGKWMLDLAHATDLPQVPPQYLPKK